MYPACLRWMMQRVRRPARPLRSGRMAHAGRKRVAVVMSEWTRAWTKTCAAFFVRNPILQGVLLMFLQEWVVAATSRAKDGQCHTQAPCRPSCSHQRVVNIDGENLDGRSLPGRVAQCCPDWGFKLCVDITERCQPTSRDMRRHLVFRLW